MKKYLLVLVMVFALAGTAFALGDMTNDGTNNGVGIIGTGNTVTNAVTNTSVVGEGGKVTSSSKANSQAGAFSGGNTQIVESTQQFLPALPIIPIPIPLIQGGRVGDVTAQVPKLSIQAKPYNGEPVVKILKIVKGSIFKRTRLEDIELDILDAWTGIVNKYGSKDFDLGKVRYIVQYKDSAMGSGIGGGGAGALSSIGNSVNPMAATGSLAILPGYARSTADPAYFIKFFLVE